MAVHSWVFDKSAEIPALFCRLTRVKIGVRIRSPVISQEVRRRDTTRASEQFTRLKWPTLGHFCQFRSQTEQNTPIKKTQSKNIRSNPSQPYMQIKLQIALLSFAVVPLFAFVPPRLVATKAKTALSSRVGSKTALYVKSLQVRVIDRICLCVEHTD